MKLEQQVVSLELAQKLKSLGVKQESLFRWGEIAGMSSILYGNELYMGAVYSAFTVAELADLMPSYQDMWVIASRNADTWSVKFFISGKLRQREQDTSLANAYAQMLVFLIEKNYAIL